MASFPKSEYIWLDGKFVPWDEATVHVGTHALHYGSSVFEGLRAYATAQGPAIFCLDPHVDRFFDSAKMLRIPIPYDRAEIRQVIIETVRVNKLESCYIRPIVFRGFGGFALDHRKYPVQVSVFAFPWGTYLGAEALEQGVDVGVSSWRRMAPDTLPAMGKLGGQYINSSFVAMEANDNGYTEGIVLDIDGYVCEGSAENIFIVLENVVYTPPLGSSILRGVTRTAVFAILRDLGYSIVEQKIPREMLYIADEIFFTGTAAEITPVRSVDHVTIGQGARGAVTKQVQDEFFAIVQGRAADRYGWLTYVNQVPAKSERQPAVLSQ